MKILHIFLVLGMVFAANIAKADDPLMVIRFNSEVVDYQGQLNKVVIAAWDAKPTVFFDVVTIVPDTKSSSKNRQNKKLSTYYTSQVEQTMEASGISKDNIRVTYQDSKMVDSSEVHIYAR